MSGYFGDALNPEKGDCKSCDCYHIGTTETSLGPLACDQLSGQCQCKPHVVGVNCDQCEVGYFNIISGDVSHKHWRILIGYIRVYSLTRI